jgi:hypothetical protein
MKHLLSKAKTSSSDMSRYLVPILRVKKASPALEQFWLFMERNGTHLITLEGDAATDDATALEAAREFCEVNDLSAADDPFCSGLFVFVPVDPSDKDLAAFYSWAETPPGTLPLREVWRPFLWVHLANDATSDSSDPWGVNKLLDMISVADNVTVYSVLQTFLKSVHASPQSADEAEAP